MADERDSIVYDIINHELKSDLPTASKEKDYSFVFEGFSDEAYHKGNKPYVFIANLTPTKKNEIESRGATVAQGTDDKGVFFDWGDLIWHYDFLYEDYLTLWDAGETKDGRIYFTRKSDAEIINSPGSIIDEEYVDNKMNNFKKNDYKQLLFNALSAIRRADGIINAEGSQS